MSNKHVLLKFMEEIVIELNCLSESDISKLESGGYSISLKVVKNKSLNNIDNEITDELKNDMLASLQNCKTREEGYDVLSNFLTTRKKSEAFAKFLDVSVSKQDKADQIKDKIVEATIGATIRSNAIKGKQHNQ